MATSSARRQTAVTPLLPIPLTGPVRLVTPKEGVLPVLKLHLTGLLTIDLTGKTALSKEGRVQNTFEGIPDVPLSRFELALKGGKAGILKNIRALNTARSCAATRTSSATAGRARRSSAASRSRGKLKSATSRSRARATAGSVTAGSVLTVRGTKKVTALGPDAEGHDGARQAAGRIPPPVVEAGAGTPCRSGPCAGRPPAKRHKRKLRVRVSMGKAHTTLRVRVR